MATNHVFTGVFIPAKIWLNPNISPVKKMILGEVKALSEETGWCFASNSHFSKWLGCTPQNVSIFLSQLEKDGQLQILFSDQKTHSGRKMRVNIEWYNGLSQAVPPLSQAVPPLSQAVTERQFKDTFKKEEEKDAALSATSESEFFTLEAEKEKNTPPVAPAPPTHYIRTYNDPEHPDFSIVEPAPMPPYQPDPRSNAPAPIELVSIPDEIEALKNDPAVKEAFTLSRKIPSRHFEEYVEAFRIDIAGRKETYPNAKKFRAHFFNWAGIRWEIDKKKPEPPKNPNAKPFQYRQI